MSTRKDITMEEVRKHNLKDDLWLVMEKKVYDLTDYKHPGGWEILKEFAGGAKDADKAFTDNDHSKEAQAIKYKRCLGELIKGSTFIDETANEKIDVQVIF